MSNLLEVIVLYTVVPTGLLAVAVLIMKWIGR